MKQGLLVLSSFYIFIISVAGYNIDTPEYNATFPNLQQPEAKIYSNGPNPVHILSLLPSSFTEIQLPPNIHTFTTAEEFAHRVLTENSTIVSYRTADINFTSSEIDQPNQTGIQFNGTFPNGATISISYTINLENSLDLLIPRLAGDENCDLTNSSSKNDMWLQNCTCDSHRTLAQNSFEFTMVITNWTMAPLEEGFGWSHLIMNMDITGAFDIQYYMAMQDYGDMLSFEVCDVGQTVLNFTTGPIPLNFFANAITDGNVTQIGTIFDSNSARFGPEGITFPFQILFNNFSDSLVYDPDFSIVLGGRGGTGDETGESDSSGADHTTMAVLVGVLVPVFLIVAIVIAVVAVIVIARKRKLRQSQVLSALERTSSAY